MTDTGYLNEDTLPDDYPVYAGYVYVKPDNGTWCVFVSDMSGTVAQLARYEQVTEIRRCNIAARAALAVKP